MLSGPYAWIAVVPASEVLLILRRHLFGMKRWLARIPWLLLLALPGLSALGPASLMAGEPQLTVKREDCEALVKYRQPPGVAYEPGVDAYGNAVAPADLPGSNQQLNLPPLIAIPIEVDLQNRLRVPGNRFQPPGNRMAPRPQPFEADAVVGIVVSDLDGNVTFNGQPLGDTEADALAEACARGLGQSR